MRRSEFLSRSSQIIDCVIGDQMETSACGRRPARWHIRCIADLRRVHIINPLDQSCRRLVIFEPRKEPPLVLDPGPEPVHVKPLHSSIGGFRTVLSRRHRWPGRRPRLHLQRVIERSILQPRVTVIGLRRAGPSAGIALIKDHLRDRIDGCATHRLRGVLPLPHFDRTTRTALLHLLILQPPRRPAGRRVDVRIVHIDVDQPRARVQGHVQNP